MAKNDTIVAMRRLALCIPTLHNDETMTPPPTPSGTRREPERRIGRGGAARAPAWKMVARAARGPDAPAARSMRAAYARPIPSAMANPITNIANAMAIIIRIRHIDIPDSHARSVRLE